MNKQDVLTITRHELVEAISKTVPTIPAPLSVSPWVAMSLLQKAIRRSRVNLALRAAATLLRDSPDRLWRRSGCVAFEDIGLAHMETVSLVTAALTGKRFRSTLGGEWAVANFIVSMMARVPKCRAADDLLIVAEQHPAYAVQRREYATLETCDLLEIAIGPEPLPVRAIALWFALGTDRRPSAHLPGRKGEPGAVFDFLCGSGYPHTLAEIAREAFRKTHEVLCPFVLLLSDQGLHSPPKLADDEPPMETLIRGIPGWTYDLYSREGHRALEAFLRRNSATARWMRTNVPASKRVQVFGAAVFRVEGGLVKDRLRWPIGVELRRAADLECFGPYCPDGSELLRLVRSDLPALNQVRRHVC